MSRHLSPAQVALLDQFEAGEFGDVEFVELALEAGLPMGRIERALAERRELDCDRSDLAAEAAVVARNGEARANG